MGGERQRTVQSPRSAAGLLRAGWGCGRAGTAVGRDGVKGSSAPEQLKLPDPQHHSELREIPKGSVPHFALDDVNVQIF